MKITIDLPEDVARRINGVLFIAIEMMERESKNEKHSQAWRTLKARDANDLKAIDAVIDAALAQEVA